MDFLQELEAKLTEYQIPFKRVAKQTIVLDRYSVRHTEGAFRVVDTDTDCWILDGHAGTLALFFVGARERAKNR